MTTPLDKAEGVSRLAPDGRTWLECAAEWHDAQSEACYILMAKAHARGDKQSAETFSVQSNRHEAMSQACREAMG